MEWSAQYEDTYSLLFVEHRLVYLEGTISGPSDMPGSGKSYNVGIITHNKDDISLEQHGYYLIYFTLH